MVFSMDEWFGDALGDCSFTLKVTQEKKKEGRKKEHQN